MNMHIDGAANCFDPTHELTGKNRVFCSFSSVYLHVNRRRNAKIQNLGDNISVAEKRIRYRGKRLPSSAGILSIYTLLG
ncbi:MAG: hypothetical protein WDM70_03345 [Nitrosomonadales bacterium]